MGKTALIADFLKTIPDEDIRQIVLLLQGKIFPDWDSRKIGVASRLVLKAINLATGINVREIEAEWKSTGDLGLVARNLVKRKLQATLFSQALDVSKVFSNLQKLATLEGEGTVDKKIQVIAELLTSANPDEACYIVRSVLEDLRVGVGEGGMRDAITWAFFGEEASVTFKEGEVEVADREVYNKYIDAVQRSYHLTNDFSLTAEAAKNGLDALKKTSVEVGRPIKVMLALKVSNVAEGFERVGSPAELEYKYDGFRLQIHKTDSAIHLFTRRLEDVTKQFPDVVSYISSHVSGSSFILDSEVVGFDPKTGKYLPFQNISQRIRRKYEIGRMAAEFPVEVNVFDVLSYEGKTLIDDAFSSRRALLEKIVKPEEKKIIAAKHLVTESKDEAQKFYEESVAAGNEGVMFKSLSSPYQPGGRVGFMVKLKSEKDSIDLVIVGAEWGEGKRASWLSSFTLACIDENGNFLEIGKVGTGIKEKEEEGVSFQELTKLLEPLIVSEKGKNVKVKPRIVVEISYEEVQKSPTYTSGYALRFPRFKLLRHTERSPEDIVTLDEIRSLFAAQSKA